MNILQKAGEYPSVIVGPLPLDKQIIINIKILAIGTPSEKVLARGQPVESRQ
jgi:hypothetical protein